MITVPFAVNGVGMSNAYFTIALMAAQTPLDTSSGAPVWIHLLPRTDRPILTRDGRGPYGSIPAEQLIANSLSDLGELPIDENHALDLAAPRGQRAAALGWIRELQAREDGIWGRVDWTPGGTELMAAQAYRYVSPVISVERDNLRITRILRASLVNRPNLRGMVALNAEDSDMSLLERLTEIVGLHAEASEAEVIDAVTGLKAQAGGDAVALQSQLAEIGTILGAPGDDHAALVLAARKATAGEGGEATVALQAELAAVTTRFNMLAESVSRKDATAFVDGEIRKGRIGVKPLRDHYISRHMADAASVEKEIGALPLVTQGTAAHAPPPEDVSAHAVDPQALAAKATVYQRKLSDSGQSISFSAAVRAVQEGNE